MENYKINQFIKEVFIAVVHLNNRLEIEKLYSLSMNSNLK